LSIIQNNIECNYFETKATDEIGKSFKIFINPSDVDIKMIKTINDNDIRGIIFPDGKEIYLWDAALRHKDIEKVIDISHKHYINIHEGQRFHLDDSVNGWGWDFDYGRRVNLYGAKEYIKRFEKYLRRFGDIENLPLYLWGIEDLGKGPFGFTYEELFK